MTAPVTLQCCVQGAGPGPLAQRLASVTQQLEMERTKTHQVVRQERTKATQLELQVRLQAGNGDVACMQELLDMLQVSWSC